ncbi:hypothetical protein CCMSSC00406_0005981 [Pleurotus cornucopiae]|uniref:Uncharacterized protein n=1 Tax=Pleurotus cornucopiae TaxID=5321 RepID=A0ACB7INB0_PLECO|nr:hypothetical protein CCMSSC00406_0005981 [Pleurotus cornucopiae]
MRLVLDVDDQHVPGDADGDAGEDGREDGDNEYEEEDDSEIDEDLYDPEAFPGLADTDEAYIRALCQEDLRWGLSMTCILRRWASFSNSTTLCSRLDMTLKDQLRF